VYRELEPPVSALVVPARLSAPVEWLMEKNVQVARVRIDRIQITAVGDDVLAVRGESKRRSFIPSRPMATPLLFSPRRIPVLILRQRIVVFAARVWILAATGTYLWIVAVGAGALLILYCGVCSP